jgi:hypothetical protein
MNKNFKVNYLARDFASIKKELQNYAKRYYPDNFADLSEASINTLLIDSVAYVGDILSFYTDYQGNESFLATAIESRNILNLAKELGYKRTNTHTSTGIVSFYLLIPAATTGGPDFNRAPRIKKGTLLNSSTSSAVFTVSDDVVIDTNLIGVKFVVARTNTLGNPTYYAVKVDAPVISGELKSYTVKIGNFTKFNKLFLPDQLAVEIVSVSDSDGNIYYEVSNLSQNVIYKSIPNPDTSSEVKSLLRTFSAQRRFVFDIEEGVPFLMFGGKQYKPDDDLTIDPITEPSKYILDRYNSDYLADSYFEPNRLLNGDQYGIGPDNTTLTIVYRANSSADNNIGAGELTGIKNLVYEFKPGVVDNETLNTIVSSFQVINEKNIIGDSVSISFDEVKDLAGMVYQAQNRAVTAKDYEALSYMMPTKYGAIARVKAERDAASLKNNINLYVICKDSSGVLTAANTKIKENLKYWLSGYKMITDTVDILDTKIINLGVSFTLMVDPNFVKADVLKVAKDQLASFFLKSPQIGEAFSYLDIYRELRKVAGVLDIKDKIKVRNISSTGYSPITFNIESNLSADGNLIIMPRNAIWEIKNPSIDIIGNVL